MSLDPARLRLAIIRRGFQQASGLAYSLADIERHARYVEDGTHERNRANDCHHLLLSWHLSLSQFNRELDQVHALQRLLDICVGPKRTLPKFLEPSADHAVLFRWNVLIWGLLRNRSDFGCSPEGIQMCLIRGVLFVDFLRRGRVTHMIHGDVNTLEIDVKIVVEV